MNKDQLMNLLERSERLAFIKNWVFIVNTFESLTNNLQVRD
jgi:hypothetical protein